MDNIYIESEHNQEKQMKLSHAEVEQNVADQLFIRHGMVLNNGIVNGVNIGLDLEEEWTSGGWMQSRRNGKVRVTVGGYMSSTRKVGFRELKKGGFNYDKIADKFVEKYNELVARNVRLKETESKNQDYDVMIKRAVEKHDIYQYGGALSKKHSKDYSRVFGLQVKLNVTTNEQIDALLTLAKELGINISH